MNKSVQESYFGSFSWLIFGLLAILMLFLIVPKGGVMSIGEQAYMSISALVAICIALAHIFKIKVKNRGGGYIVWLLPIFTLICIVFVQAYYSHEITVAELQASFGLNNVYLSIPTLKNVVYFSSFWILAYSVSKLTRHQMIMLGCLVVFVVLAQALFGLWAVMSNKVHIFGLWEKKYYLESATGTFVNKNHFAGFFALTTPLVLASLISQPSIDQRLSAMHVFAASLFVVIIGVAVVMSHSRMGFVLFLVGVIVWMVLHNKSIQQSEYVVSRFSAGANKFIYLSCIALLVMFLLWFGIDDVIDRFHRLENGDSRFEVWRALVDLPFSVWLWGVGVSNFAEAFNYITPTYFRQTFNFAHNDYLEFAVEIGLLGSILMIFSILLCVFKCIPSSHICGLRVGATASLIAIGLHSIVDFNLQIPANGLFASIAFGILMNANLTESVEVLGKTKSRRRKRGGKKDSSQSIDDVFTSKRPKLTMVEN